MKRATLETLRERVYARRDAASRLEYLEALVAGNVCFDEVVHGVNALVQEAGVSSEVLAKAVDLAMEAGILETVPLTFESTPSMESVSSALSLARAFRKQNRPRDVLDVLYPYVDADERAHKWAHEALAVIDPTRAAEERARTVSSLEDARSNLGLDPESVEATKSYVAFLRRGSNEAATAWLRRTLRRASSTDLQAYCRKELEAERQPTRAFFGEAAFDRLSDLWTQLLTKTSSHVYSDLGWSEMLVATRLLALGDTKDPLTRRKQLKELSTQARDVLNEPYFAFLVAQRLASENPGDRQLKRRMRVFGSQVNEEDREFAFVLRCLLKEEYTQALELVEAWSASGHGFSVARAIATLCLAARLECAASVDALLLLTRGLAAAKAGETLALLAFSVTHEKARSAWGTEALRKSPGSVHATLLAADHGHEEAVVRARQWFGEWPEWGGAVETASIQGAGDVEPTSEERSAEQRVALAADEEKPKALRQVIANAQTNARVTSEALAWKRLAELVPLGDLELARVEALLVETSETEPDAYLALLEARLFTQERNEFSKEARLVAISSSKELAQARVRYANARRRGSLAWERVVRKTNDVRDVREAFQIVWGWGEIRDAFGLVRLALVERPDDTEILEDAERAALAVGLLSELSALYMELGRRSYGRLGVRAVHFRAANMFERAGKKELAYAHSVRAIEAAPTEGSLLTQLRRLAAEHSDRGEAVRALAAVADRTKDREAKCRWFLTAASFVANDDEGARQRFDLAIRALLASMESASLEELARASESLRSRSEGDREIVALRLRNAIFTLTHTMESPSEVRAGLLLLPLLLIYGDDADAAIAIFSKCVATDPDLPEYEGLLPHQEVLLSSTLATELLNRERAKLQRSPSSYAMPLLSWMGECALRAGELALAASLAIYRATEDPNAESIERAERLLENVEDHGAFQRYERAIPKEERGEALVRMGRAARETNQNDANKYYWRALYAAPESEEIAIELDTALIETGNQEKRLELLSFRAERATQEKKRCALKVARIRLLVTLGQKETALRELHPVLERWPEEEGVRTLAAELIAPKAVPEAGGMGVEARAPEAKSVADEDQTVPTLLPVFSDPPSGIVTRGTTGWDEAYAAFCHSPADFSVLDALVRHAKSVAHTRAIEHVRAAIHGEPTEIPNLRAQQYAANALELTCPSTPALEILETIWERAGRTLQKKPGFQAAGKEPIDPNVQSDHGKNYQGVLNALSAPKVQMFGEHAQGGPL
ncbi:MAG: hypothetical protein KBF88_05570, partial [Polyangiaceae bacterium]|nr:hypothetical protein [Polyangiaceae bacterium]